MATTDGADKRAQECWTQPCRAADLAGRVTSPRNGASVDAHHTTEKRITSLIGPGGPELSASEIGVVTAGCRPSTAHNSAVLAAIAAAYDTAAKSGSISLRSHDLLRRLHRSASVLRDATARVEKEVRTHPDAAAAGDTARAARRGPPDRTLLRRVLLRSCRGEALPVMVQWRCSTELSNGLPRWPPVWLLSLRAAPDRHGPVAELHVIMALLCVACEALDRLASCDDNAEADFASRGRQPPGPIRVEHSGLATLRGIGTLVSDHLEHARGQGVGRRLRVKGLWVSRSGDSE